MVNIFLKRRRSDHLIYHDCNFWFIIIVVWNRFRARKIMIDVLLDCSIHFFWRRELESDRRVGRWLDFFILFRGCLGWNLILNFYGVDFFGFDRWLVYWGRCYRRGSRVRNIRRCIVVFLCIVRDLRWFYYQRCEWGIARIFIRSCGGCRLGWGFLGSGGLSWVISGSWVRVRLYLVWFLLIRVVIFQRRRLRYIFWVQIELVFDIIWDSVHEYVLIIFLMYVE